MGSYRGAPSYAERRRRPGCRTRFGRRKKKKDPVAGTGKRSSRPRKGRRETPIPGTGGAAAERRLAKAGCRDCPGLKPGRGWSLLECLWLVCPWLESDSFRHEQHANRAGEDTQVQEQTPVLDVSEIKVHVELERRTAARRNLPQTRDAGFHVKAPVVVKFVMIDFVDGMRPRSNQAHFSAQHVPELREFVEAIAADDTADAGDSGVVVNFENRAFSLVAVAQLFLQVFGVGHHGAKLIAAEAAPFGAGAFRGVDNRTGRVQPDEQGHDRHHRA